VVLSDMRMPHLDGGALLQRIAATRPDLPVLIMTAYGSIEDAVKAMRAGAADYLVKPFDPQALISRVSRYMVRHERLPDFVAGDPTTLALLDLAARVADTDATVMITGPSGAGKEVLARFLHQRSARRDGVFVAINCAAIPENMLEATLFGHEKGAFTGALQARAGKFEQAQGGTLLLDEVTEMPLELQAKLLRVLQEREVERLGAQRTIALDVRVIATTNRDLVDAVRAGRFREDLYFRLNVFPLHLPPLRQRLGDILPLTRALLARAAMQARRSTPRLAPDVQAALLDHSWPGNVRELDNLVQRALILQQGEVIEVADLHFERGFADEDGGGADPLDGDDLRQREQAAILDTLRRVRGNRSRAAERLGISQRTLRYKLARIRERGIAIPGDER
jgi:two-component system response regulator FlrC